MREAPLMEICGNGNKLSVFESLQRRLHFHDSEATSYPSTGHLED